MPTNTPSSIIQHFMGDNLTNAQATNFSCRVHSFVGRGDTVGEVLTASLIDGLPGVNFGVAIFLDS